MSELAKYVLQQCSSEMRVTQLACTPRFRTGREALVRGVPPVVVRRFNTRSFEQEKCSPIDQQLLDADPASYMQSHMEICFGGEGFYALSEIGFTLPRIAFARESETSFLIIVEDLTQLEGVFLKDILTLLLDSYKPGAPTRRHLSSLMITASTLALKYVKHAWENPQSPFFVDLCDKRQLFATPSGQIIPFDVDPFVVIPKDDMETFCRVAQNIALGVNGDFLHYSLDTHPVPREVSTSLLQAINEICATPILPAKVSRSLQTVQPLAETS